MQASSGWFILFGLSSTTILHLCVSLLDMQVYLGMQLDNDHELVVSNFCFKIKCKRHWNAWRPRKEATILNSTQCNSLITTMKEALAMRQNKNQENDMWKCHGSPSRIPLWKQSMDSLTSLWSWYRIGSQKDLPKFQGRVRHGCSCAILKQTIPIFPSYSSSITSRAVEPTHQLRR